MRTRGQGDWGCDAMTIRSVADDALDWGRQQVTSRVPRADLDQRDPDYIRDRLPGTWLLASLYFRAEVRGLPDFHRRHPVNDRPESLQFTDQFTGLMRRPRDQHARR